MTKKLVSFCHEFSKILYNLLIPGRIFISFLQRKGLEDFISIGAIHLAITGKICYTKGIKKSERGILWKRMHSNMRKRTMFR